MINPAYCQNCGEHYESIPAGVSRLDPKFKGWNYLGHECGGILEAFRPKTTLEGDGAITQRIGKFCEKCRQVVCICDHHESTVEQLKAHLNSINQEQFNKEWSEIEELGLEGPTVQEWLDPNKEEKDHLTQLIWMIDEFVADFHPLKHSTSYKFFKNKLNEQETK